MKNSSRREFIRDSAKTAAGIGFISLTSNSEFAMTASKNLFVHHVYFWLNNPDSSEELKKLLEGLQKLSTVKTIKMFHIGKPAGTNRDVIDGSYSVSWLLLFNNRADQDSYQTDPIHLKFIDECKHLWKKVVVYDSIDT
ncbi:MAG: Dabb family protein [Chitinophagaceae bacterium]|nr:Dabb family protein [Chitinophagaceae bacterium]